ncbi:MAG: hypothetical protein K6F76_05965 [Clostridiales bacterium]|nr:hypothetical protein [Clostridiales bacterium]
MDNNLETRTNGFTEDLLTSFSLFLSKEIQLFYQSDEGKTYYENWLKDHPEYQTVSAEKKTVA